MAKHQEHCSAWLPPPTPTVPAVPLEPGFPEGPCLSQNQKLSFLGLLSSHSNSAGTVDSRILSGN